MATLQTLLTGLFFFLFGVVPFVYAMKIENWFWKRFRLFGKLYEMKQTWDEETIPAFSGSLTIKQFRETDGLGSKVTVAHHLATAANDVKEQIRRSQILSFIVSVAGVILSVGGAAKASGSQAANIITNTQGQLAPASAAVQQQFEIIGTIASALQSFLVPFAPLLGLIYAFAVTYSLWDQVRKYEDALDPAAAKRRAS